MNKKNNKPLRFALAFFLLSTGLIITHYLIINEHSHPSADPPPSNQNRAVSSQRIICATPSITEIVFALGCGSQVVGVSDFSFYPPEAEKTVKIGGLINPNTERILSLKPDLIIFQGKHEKLARFCQRQKIRSFSVKIDRLQDIISAINLIGKELEAETQASILTNQIQAELDALEAMTRQLKPKKVFLSLSHTPGDLTGIMTTGPGTFLHELIELSGGTNIFSDASLLYPHISKEALIVRQPDVIIEVFALGISAENRTLLRKDWMRLASLRAVKEENIHFLTEDYVLIPGVRVVQAAKRMALILHPEVFHE